MLDSCCCVTFCQEKISYKKSWQEVREIHAEKISVFQPEPDRETVFNVFIFERESKSWSAGLSLKALVFKTRKCYGRES